MCPYSPRLKSCKKGFYRAFRFTERKYNSPAKKQHKK